VTWHYAVHRIMPVMRSPFLCGLRFDGFRTNATERLPHSA
jgi:hypothetical protein